jgi:hypothetical protein
MNINSSNKTKKNSTIITYPNISTIITVSTGCHHYRRYFALLLIITKQAREIVIDGKTLKDFEKSANYFCGECCAGEDFVLR